MTSFRKRLREYAIGQISGEGEHKRTELAAAFLADNLDVAREYMQDLAERQIAELIKELCDEPAQDPLPIFAGFPAAITVAPGVVKATENCTLNDLGIGLEYRRKNVSDAQRKLAEYGDAMARFEALRTREDETVGECAQRLRATQQKDKPTP